jgi:transposase-like protein
MERTHTPLSCWFWAAYLVASHTNGLSAVQFQRQLGLTRYETAFQILHKLRAGMVRPDQDRIGASPDVLHVEADETYIGGRTRGEGRGVHHMALVAGAVEVRERDKPNARSKRRNGRYAGRVRLALLPNRGARALGGFIGRSVEPAARIVTDDWTGYAGLGERYAHTTVAERGDPAVAEEYLPIIHLVFSNLKTWLRGTHHGVSPQHLQAYLNEFTFRFNRRFYPFNAFRSLLGIAGDVTAPTYVECYSAKSGTTTSSGWV